MSIKEENTYKYTYGKFIKNGTVKSEETKPPKKPKNKKDEK